LSLDANILRTVAPATKRTHLVILTLIMMCLVWSAIRPHDYFTWLLEVAPAFIGSALMLRTYYTFRPTILLYVLLASYACILLIGGDFIYAKVPLFDWVRDSISRRFVPFILTREILIRRSPLRLGKWLRFFVGRCASVYSSGRSPCGLGDAQPGSRIERWNGYSAGSLSSNSCAKSSTAVCSLISAASASLLAVRPKWAQS
jgi:hypothetical protein